MSQGIIETIGGAALIVAGVILEPFTAGASTLLIAAGAGMIMSGVGTMLSQGPLQGFATATRNPVAPWDIVYGRKRVGGTIVFLNSFGDNDKYLDLVMVLAAHPCQSVDALLFDQQRIQMVPTGPGKTSVSPTQQNVVIADIQRVGNVVTVKTVGDIPSLIDGDQVLIQQVPGDPTLNGKYPVAHVVHGAGYVQFTYLCGGPASHVVSAGHVLTTWVDYGTKVYMETLLGTQALGTTFGAMSTGTPNDGNIFDLVQNPANPWTSNCSLVGMTAVWLRLHYNDKIFANGLPQISFLVHGKNDIYDPRTSPPSHGYTENAALCIADYLTNKTWGFKQDYGAGVPIAPLIAAANICDEAVTLAWPATSPASTEPRYTCNGGFQLSMKRGDVLRNLLTSCAGRLTYFGGQYVIWPGGWYGVSGSITGSNLLSMATGDFRWRPNVSLSSRYNGVKGTYISPANNWQSSDFPRYAQDATHGYTWGLAPTHDANLDADNGDRRWLDIQLPFTISASMAQRIAKIELLRRLNQGTGTFALNMAGYQFTPMDVVAMDLAYFGWSGKNLEVLDTRLKFDSQPNGSGSVVLMGVEIDVQETDPSIYSWSIGEELSPQGYQQAILPDTRTPASPTNVFGSSADNSITITWDAPTDAYVLNGGHIEAQYQLVASPEGLWISMAKMEPTITQAIIRGLAGGDQYNIRVRAVNAAGVPSDWVTAAPLGSSPATPGPITVVAALALAFPGADGTVGTAFSASLSATGGFMPYVFSVASGALPAGLSLNSSTGVISGTPTTANAYTFTARVTDNSGATSDIECLITISVATVAPAPNVSSATCSVSLILWANKSVPAFGGNITLPSSLGTLAIIEVFAVSPAGVEFFLQRFDSGLTGGGIIAYNGYNSQIQQTGSAQSGWSVKFICYNSAYAPTASPYTVGSLTIPAAGISSISAVDNTAARWQDTDGAVHAVVPVTLGLANYPQIVTLWTNSPQYGRIWHGWFQLSSGGAINIGQQNTGTSIFPPTNAASETVTVYAAIGTWDAATDPTTITGYASTTVSVSGPSAPGSTDAHGAYITAASPLYSTGPGGASQFSFITQQVLPITSSDNPDKFWVMRRCVQTGKYVAGVWTPGGQRPNTPDPTDSRTVVGDYAGPTAWYPSEDHADNVHGDPATGIILWAINNWDVPSDGYNIFRIVDFIASRRSGGTWVQQNEWSAAAGTSTPGTNAYQELTVDGTKSYTTRAKGATGSGTVHFDDTTTGLNVYDGTGGVSDPITRVTPGNIDIFDPADGMATTINHNFGNLSAGQLNYDSTGKFTKYNNTSLVGLGMPHDVYRSKAASQTSSAHLTPTLSAGLYRISAVLWPDSYAGGAVAGSVQLSVLACLVTGGAAQYQVPMYAVDGSGSFNGNPTYDITKATALSMASAVFYTDGSTFGSDTGVGIYLNVGIAWSHIKFSWFLLIEKLDA